MLSDRFEQTGSVPDRAEVFRAAARQLLQERYPLASEVELTGLSLYEQSLLKAPKELVLDPQSPLDPLGSDSAYTAALVSLLGGCGGGLTPAVTNILRSFRCWSSPPIPGQLRTLGEFSDQVAATRATGASTPLACGEFSVELSGHLTPQEVTHVHAALQEIVGKTQTKALHLVKAIYLRPFLAESVDAEGVAHRVDGLAYGTQMVGLQNATARDPKATRQALFHELGHELDHILSGPTSFFRSSRQDTPFGKSDEARDYVSDYAMSSPHEDFAETHALLIQQWDGAHECPDLFVHSRGKIGEKMAWISQKGYRVEVPPPSGRWGQLQELVEQGKSPIADGKALEKVASALRKHWPQPDSPEEAWLLGQLTP